jgi:alpha-tubulin suppressor-like RCC1 family protein
MVSGACKRPKPPIASRVWLGPGGGCVETPTHPTSGTFACWGVNEAGQIGDGTTTSRLSAMKQPFDAGKVADMALGERHTCAVFETADKKSVACWGDGSRGQLGSGTPASLVPVATIDESGPALAVAVGDQHTCIRSGAGDKLRCFGANDAGQLGGPEEIATSWSKGAPIRDFALGAAHTCAAYGKGVSNAMVVCRGRTGAAPREPLLESVVVKELAAGGNHTCALLDDLTARCWGKNDAGQLGDDTTSDSAVPVSIHDLRDIAQIAAGSRHTCALLRNGTIACWGDNSRHQLASGTTENSSRPRVIVGLVQAREIVAAGDGTCARLEGGYVRCWGANERGQLGDGSTVEHTVPAQVRFR